MLRHYDTATTALPGDLAQLDMIVDRLAAQVRSGQPPRPILFLAVAREAVGHLKYIGRWDVREMLDLLVGKQHDYGHHNIDSFGLTGLVVRLSDKVARLANLAKRNTDYTFNEPVLDTWRDIVGYCVIAEMWMDRTFHLDLKESA